MTSRERLLRVFNGQAPDRTPITLFITDSDIEDGPPTCILGEISEDTIGELIRFHELLGIDIMLRVGVNVFEPIAFDCNAPEWHNVWEPLQDSKHLVHQIVTPGGTLQEVFNLEGEDFRGEYSQNWMKLRNVRTESLIKSPEDLDIVKQYRPPIPNFDFSHIAGAKDRLGNGGIVLPRAPSSVFNYAVGLVAAEDLLLKPLLEADFYRDLMVFCLQDVIQVGELIAAGGGDVVRVVGNIANSGLVSPEFYREHILPFEQRYIDALSQVGGKVLFHNCGQCASLLGVYRDMLDSHTLESLSTRRTGGDIASLRYAREALGDNIVMVGNFDQVSLLKDGPQEEIREEVRKIGAETQGDKRFILSTSDSIVPGTPAENVRVLVESAFEVFN